MTDWRAPLALLLLAAVIGAASSLSALPAVAQPAAPAPSEGGISDSGPEVPPKPKSKSGAQPQSPAEEVAMRQARLDGLFGRLTQKDDPNWDKVEGEIWLTWSQSGSPAMDLLLLRAGRAMGGGDSELALRHLDDLVRLAPDFAEGWNKRATVYFLLNEYGNSVADIERTLALEPRHFGALSGLGMILERVGDKKGAMRAYRRGLEIHPNLPGAAAGVERLSPDVDGRKL
jgi:tetratricopeptide (TPR) repeat protein